MQDLNDMLYFAEVVERGGFAAASRALGVPKSRLSRRIAELEARLGARLLQRTTRRLSLTDVGEVYLRHCVAMRNEANAARDAVARVRAEPGGTVRASCPVTIAQGTLGPLLPRFMSENPQVRLDLRITNQPVDPVADGIDVALRVRPSLGDSATLIVKQLGEARTYVVVSPDLLRRAGPLAGPQDLARVETVAMSATDGRTSWQLQGPEGAVHTWHHEPRYVADDLLTLRFAVLQGIGATYLPTYMCADDLHAGRLVQLLPGWAPPSGQLHAVFASRRGLLPAVRRFLDFLGEHVRSDQPVDCPPPSR